MRETILRIIEELQADKETRHVTPSAVTYTELSNKLHEQVKSELNSMIKDGLITWNRTLNDKAFQIKQ